MGSRSTPGADGGKLIPAARLVQWSTDVVEAVGAPPRTAHRVAESLVESDLRGYSSHGVLRLPGYVADVLGGVIDPRAEPATAAGGRGGAFVVDGRNAFGQLTAEFAVEELARRATEAGVSFTVTRRCRHVGRLGAYAERLASRGFIAFAAVKAEPLVAAPAGRRPVIGTNPHAWGIPAGHGEPAFIADFATSAVSAGRVLSARASGQSLAPGQIVDRDGAPSLDPRDFLDGGALLPFGGHKGFALGLVAEILGSLLSAGEGEGEEPSGDTPEHGLAMLAIDISTFTPLEAFGAQLEALRRRIATSTPGEEDVCLPGEGSARRRAATLRRGVSIPVSTATELDALARSVGVRPLGQR